MNSPNSPETLIFTRHEVAALLTLEECMNAVESAFAAHGRGDAPTPGVLALHANHGGFHMKAGLLEVDGREFFVAKCNGNFPRNRERHSLPTIQGVVLLCDAGDGRVLALMDSSEITMLRTGAATAVAARYLAREDAGVATIAGCGMQGRVQLRALAHVRPLQAAFAFDQNPAIAVAFAREMSLELGVAVRSTDDLSWATAQSDLVVSCTPATAPIIHRGAIRPGTFVAGVGADSEEKWELAPGLLADATVVVDVLEQAAAIGDLHHAIDAGVMTRESVHATLGEIVAGGARSRAGDDEIIVFDSTGMALQDAAAAAAVYARALSTGGGHAIRLG